jgi:muconolactone delta-isomerase
VRYKLVHRKEDRIKTLWALLIENPDDLSNKQIEALLREENKLSAELHRRFGCFPQLWKRVLQIRTKQKGKYRYKGEFDETNDEITADA